MIIGKENNLWIFQIFSPNFNKQKFRYNKLHEYKIEIDNNNYFIVTDLIINICPYTIKY